MRNVDTPAPLYLRSSWRSTNPIIIIIIIYHDRRALFSVNVVYEIVNFLSHFRNEFNKTPACRTRRSSRENLATVNHSRPTKITSILRIRVIFVTMATLLSVWTLDTQRPSLAYGRQHLFTDDYSENTREDYYQNCSALYRV